MYIDLPYRNEVLHIAVNTPQLLDVPHRLFPRILGVLKAKLQQRALKLLEECEGDPNELSRRQLEFTRFRTRVLKQVNSFIQSTQPEQQQQFQKTNGFEYSFQQHNHSVFDDYAVSLRNETPTSAKEESNEMESVFDKQRKRMNESFFASLGKRTKVEVQSEEEEECGVYLHLKELMTTDDPSVHIYGQDWSVMREGGELEQLLDEVMRSEVNEVSEVKSVEEGKEMVVDEGEVDDVNDVNVVKEVKEVDDKEKVNDVVNVVNDEKEEEVNEVKEVDDKEKVNEVEEKEEKKEEKKEKEEKETEKEDTTTLIQTSANADEDNMIEGDILFEVLNNGTLLVSRENSNMGDPTPSTETQIPSLLPTPEQTSFLLHSTPQELQEHKHTLLQQYRHFSSQNTFVSEDVILDIIEVLRVFGIPYVFAPGEAEAQCSFLEMMGLVDGIVSNDSDVFAFGGKTLYRNFFVDNRYVEAYRSDDLEKEAGFTQDRIILYAMLEGCDYCEVTLYNFQSHELGC